MDIISHILLPEADKWETRECFVTVIVYNIIVKESYAMCLKLKVVL